MTAAHRFSVAGEGPRGRAGAVRLVYEGLAACALCSSRFSWAATAESGGSS